MATYTYTYQMGHKGFHRFITSAPARREGEHQQALPGGKLTVESRGRTRAGAPRTERRQAKTRGYYA